MQHLRILHRWTFWKTSSVVTTRSFSRTRAGLSTSSVCPLPYIRWVCSESYSTLTDSGDSLAMIAPRCGRATKRCRDLRPPHGSASLSTSDNRAGTYLWSTRLVRNASRSLELNDWIVQRIYKMREKSLRTASGRESNAPSWWSLLYWRRYPWLGVDFWAQVGRSLRTCQRCAKLWCQDIRAHSSSCRALLLGNDQWCRHIRRESPATSWI